MPNFPPSSQPSSFGAGAYWDSGLQGCDTLGVPDLEAQKPGPGGPVLQVPQQGAQVAQHGDGRGGEQGRRQLRCIIATSRSRSPAARGLDWCLGGCGELPRTCASAGAMSSL